MSITTDSPGPISRAAIWSATHPWTALGLWVLAVALAFSITSLVPTRYATDTERITGQARQAADLVQASGKDEPAVEVVLVTRRDERPLAPSAPDVAAVGAALTGTGQVRAVDGPVLSADGTAALYQVVLAGDPDTAAERLGPLQQSLEDLRTAHPDLQLEQTGEASMTAEFQEWLGADLNKAAVISLPLTLVVLLVAFGALVAAGLPLVVGAGAVLSALGLWAAASQLVPDQGTVAHVILLIGMAVGVDYALFYLRRFREETHAGAGPVAATAVAARTAGHSVIVSGTAVTMAMAGLLVMRQEIYTGIAVGAILVVLAAMLSAVTAMPALMRLMHRWVDRPRLPWVWRLTGGDQSSRPLTGLLRGVIARPWAALLVAGLALTAMAAPVAGIRLRGTTIEDFPRSLPSMRTYDQVTAAFPGRTTTAQVVVHTADRDRDGLVAAAARLGELTATRPALFGGVGQPWLSPDDRYLVLDVEIAHRPDTDPARAAVRELRSDLVPAATRGLPAPRTAVGGDVAANLDDATALTRQLPWVVGIVVALTFVFMLVVYRSLVIAVVTLVLTLASTLASFGLLTLIFQGSWAQGLLGFRSNGHVVSWVPLLLFVVLCGLSLDYHVLVLNRIREYARAGLSVPEAVLAGTRRTAGVVTSAAAVMIAVFLVFATLSFIELKQIGIGLALATLLDVTVIRLIALPALLVVLRRVVWWPGAGDAEVGLADDVASGYGKPRWHTVRR